MHIRHDSTYYHGDELCYLGYFVGAECISETNSLALEHDTQVPHEDCFIVYRYIVEIVLLSRQWIQPAPTRLFHLSVLEKNQIIVSFITTNFMLMFWFQLKFPFHVNKNCTRIAKWPVCKIWVIYWNNFSFYHITPRTLVPVFNDLICFKISG